MEYRHLIKAITNPRIIQTKEMAPRRFFLYVEPLGDDEEFIIEVGFTESYGNYCLPELWYKYGYTDKVLNKYININTYRTDGKGNCTGNYNPQTIGIHKINFDYMLETNQENLDKLIDATIKKYEEDFEKSMKEEVQAWHKTKYKHNKTKR